MYRLQNVTSKASRNILGLMSGTSVDGVDGALLRVEGQGKESRFELIGAGHKAFPNELRSRILDAGHFRTESVARLHAELGDFFGDAARAILAAIPFRPEDLDLIASHGQTIFHHSGSGRPCTLQVGDGDRIAETIGCPVISDFRSRDIAAGGEGAPLSAYPDRILFASVPKPMAVLNLGGIANVTLLGAGEDDLVGFDVGPANMVLDGLCRAASKGELCWDDEGRIAAKGSIVPSVMEWMLEDPFLQKAIPKSTGREKYGEEFTQELMRRHPGVSLEDLLATACRFSAKAIRIALDRCAKSGGGWKVMAVAGGGVRNRALMESIRRELSPMEVISSAQFGVDPDFREAMAFAILGNETVHGNPGNHPGATGAKKRVVLGKISP